MVVGLSPIVFQVFKDTATFLSRGQSVMCQLTMFTAQHASNDQLLQLFSNLDSDLDSRFRKTMVIGRGQIWA